LLTVYHKEFMDITMICLNKEFHIPRPSGLLVTAIIPKDSRKHLP